MNGRRRRHHYGAVNDRFQLPNVSRPGVHHHLVQGCLRDVERAALVTRSIQIQEVVNQLRDVVTAIAKYGNRERPHIEAVEQVLPEQFRFDALAQVRIRGGNDTDVGDDTLGRAQGTIFMFLQESQQLYLGRRTQRIDLIQK